MTESYPAAFWTWTPAVRCNAGRLVVWDGLKLLCIEDHVTSDVIDLDKFRANKTDLMLRALGQVDDTRIDLGVRVGYTELPS